MKKYLKLKVLIDESIDDSEKCADDITSQAMGHEYCCDRTVQINIIEEED